LAGKGTDAASNRALDTLRHDVIPLKAIVLNLFSVGTAYGVLVLVMVAAIIVIWETDGATHPGRPNPLGGQSAAARSDNGWPLRSHWRCPRTVSSSVAPSSSR
jgi:hypothetical protein